MYSLVVIDQRMEIDFWMLGDGLLCEAAICFCQKLNMMRFLPVNESNIFWFFNCFEITFCEGALAVIEHLKLIHSGKNQFSS